MSDVRFTAITNIMKRQYLLTDEQIKATIKAERELERELTKAASAGLFLTAADLREE